MNKLHLYFRSPPSTDRHIPGDRYIVPVLRKIIKGPKIGGIEKVFLNLCKGLDLLNVDYDVNLPFKKIKPGEPVVVLGNGRYALEGYDQSNPIIAGIGLMTHPTEWPDLFDQYPVALYLQHSEWTKNIYVPAFGADKFDLWPAGIDTEKWSPIVKSPKKFDFLVYNKVMWNKQKTGRELRSPMLGNLRHFGFSYKEITYGQYKEADYFKLLKQCRAMIFLCEHESQGFACCEALSMNVPVFAWDPGVWMDPNLSKWGEQNPIAATSIPFFSDKCGMSFNNYTGFESQVNTFWKKIKSGYFSPREYVLANLTLKKSAQRMLEIIDSVYK